MNPLENKKLIQIIYDNFTFYFCFKIKGVHEIVNPSDLDVLQNAISEKQLVQKAEMPILTFIEVSFHGRLKSKQPYNNVMINF